MKTTDKQRQYYKDYYQKNKDVAKARAAHRRRTQPEQVTIDTIRNRASQKGLEFNLEPEDVTPPEYCPILGIKLERTTKRMWVGNSPSVDRKDNTKGYTKDNIQIISNQANRMKSNATPEELVKFALWILKEYQ